jgi:exosortase
MACEEQLKMKKHDLLRLAILLFLVLIVYLPTFIWMAERWTAADTSYSHGFLVPFISGFIVWQKRKQLAKLKINPDLTGWVFFLLGLSIYAISALWQIYVPSGFSLIFTLIGLVLLFLGKDFLHQLLFSILFLILMIPLPIITIANLSFKLRIFTTQVATAILSKFGFYAIREGSVIKTAHSYLVVTDLCSGLRSLITLMALGVLVAYFGNISRPKKIILFLSSIPIAIFANIIRIASLSLINEIYGAKIATGLIHTIIGISVFVFAFLGISLVNMLLESHE